MSRLATMILVIVLMLAGVWLWESRAHMPLLAGAPSLPAPPSPAPLAPPSPAVPAEAADAAGEAADAAADAAAIAADAAAEAAIAAADSAADAAADAARGADAGNAARAVAASRQAGAAADAAADATREVAGALRGGGGDTLLLSPQGYDPAAVEAMIAASSLDPARKDGLLAALRGAAGDPQRLQEALGQVRAALQ
ncbi:hypothetical protein [Paracoccus contaminans]|uniref:hypothetical protein n=1 Tax=Paracoccus contaminans TaxID=1945662 RepID=UPI0012F5199F|nr:hypothetical protein [Paracoccus contaminans]